MMSATKISKDNTDTNTLKSMVSIEWVYKKDTNSHDVIGRLVFQKTVIVRDIDVYGASDIDDEIREAIEDYLKDEIIAIVKSS